MTELKKIEKKQKFMAQPKIIKKVFQTNKNLSNLDTQYHCKAMQKKIIKLPQPLWIGLKTYLINLM